MRRWGLAAAILVAAACSSNDPGASAGALPPLPPDIVNAVRPVPVVRAAYQFAADHPEVLRYVPCFCGCERGGHKANHDCFVASRDAAGRVRAWDEHGIACEVCVDVATIALEMHNAGATVPQIRQAVEARFGSHGGHTPTPPPPATSAG